MNVDGASAGTVDVPIPLVGSGVTAWANYLAASPQWQYSGILAASQPREVTVAGIRGLQIEISVGDGDPEVLNWGGGWTFFFAHADTYQVTVLPVHGHTVLIAVGAPTATLSNLLTKVAPIMRDLVFP